MISTKKVSIKDTAQDVSQEISTVNSWRIIVIWLEKERYVFVVNAKTSLANT